MTEKEEAAFRNLLKQARKVCFAHHVSGQGTPSSLVNEIVELGKAHDACLDAREEAEQER